MSAKKETEITKYNTHLNTRCLRNCTIYPCHTNASPICDEMVAIIKIDTHDTAADTRPRESENDAVIS